MSNLVPLDVRQAVLGIADAYHDVGCADRSASSAFYDMGVTLVIGTAAKYALEKHNELGATFSGEFHYKENNQ